MKVNKKCKVKKKKRKTNNTRVVKIKMRNCSKSVIHVGPSSNDNFVFGGTDEFAGNTTGDVIHTENTTDRYTFAKNTTVKSILMSSWSRNQVRCWLVNIGLPSYVASKFYQEFMNGYMLKFYGKRHLKKDFRLCCSNWRLILYLRKNWLRLERHFRDINSSFGPKISSVPCSICYMIKVKEDIQDILLHLKTNLRSFRDWFTELNVSDLDYLHRSDLRVWANSKDSFFIEILNEGKNNLIVGFINELGLPKLSNNFVERLSKILRKIKNTGLKSFILGDFHLLSSSKMLPLYEKKMISVLTDNSFLRLETRNAFIKNSISFYEVITNDTGVFSSGDESYI